MDERCDLLCVDAPQAEEIRRSLLGDEEAWQAAGRARALSDPTRLGLGVALREGGELLSATLPLLGPQAGACLAPFEDAAFRGGLVGSRREGKMVMYSLTNEGCPLLGAVLGERAG